MSDSTDDTDDTVDESTLESQSGTLAVSSTYKVLGLLDDPTGVGVLGQNDATSGNAYGVDGITSSGADEAAGVRGTGPGSSFGVIGRSFSTESNLPSIPGEASAGVLGLSENGLGLFAKSVGSDGVYGRSEDPGAAGVFGFGASSSGVTKGVYGETVSETDGAAGVRGEATGSTGTIYGVYGTASSSDGYGVYSAGDSKTEGNHEVGGTLVGSDIVDTGTVAAGAITNSEIDSGTTIDRSKLDTARSTTLVDSSNTASYTTDGDETVYVNTNDQSVTITLSETDGENGRSIRIVDAGGAAATNGITLQAGGAPAIEGPNSKFISTNNGYREYEYYLGVWYEVSSN